MGSLGGRDAPNIFKFARKLVKRVGYSVSSDLFIVIFNNNLVTIVGQLVRTPPPPTEGVSAHHCFMYLMWLFAAPK